MFFAKKLVSRCLFPVPLCLELLLAGLVLLWFTKRQRTGKTLVSVGAILLGLLSHCVVADRLLGPLELQHPPLLNRETTFSSVATGDPRWVAVLAGETPDPRLPMTSQLGSAGLARAVEGLRIHKKLPNSKLILSVSNSVSAENFAKELVEFAVAFGADRQDLIVLRGANDTEDEMKAIQDTVGSSAFVLVTSASHMPRAMALAQARAMNPIAAPTDHRVKKNPCDSPDEFFPDASSLYKSERAFNEYLGLAWAKLRGRI